MKNACGSTTNRGRNFDRDWRHPESGKLHQVKDSLSFHQGEDFPDVNGDRNDDTR